MVNEIISYLEMCARERASLQQGMNFQLGGNYSVFLMSKRTGAPYKDVILEDGKILVYEGHDAPKTGGQVSPKSLDQPQFTSAGKLTQNGKFYFAAQQYKKGKRDPEWVRVYEKIRPGIWSYNGLFDLIDSWIEAERGRKVFKFKLRPNEVLEGQPKQKHIIAEGESRRIIPTAVKLEVWKRDNGKCVQCGATNELHFDHIIPYTKGGTSLRSENIQLLCARHNIQKSAKIE